MPHIVIEHSKDIAKRANLPSVALKMHKALSEIETVKPEAVKTRTIKAKNVLLGAELLAEGFVHVSLLLLAGREQELKEKMAQTLFGILKEELGPEARVSVEVRDFDVYVK